MEPECQSLGLHQHPNQNAHKTANVEPDRQSPDLHRHPNQNTRTLEPECHSMDLHQLPSTQQPNKLIGSRELEPITVKHTHKKGKKVPGVVSHDHLPTYLVWNKDQGYVVPLHRGLPSEHGLRKEDTSCVKGEWAMCSRPSSRWRSSLNRVLGSYLFAIEQTTCHKIGDARKV